MPNEKNLVPFQERTESEQREIRQKGGIASGVSRRRKRSLREAADLYLSLPVADRRARNKIARRGVAPEDADNQMAMVIGLADRASQGDARAAKVLMELLDDRKTDAQIDAERESNLLDVLTRATGEDMETDDLSEIEQASESGDDLVEPSQVPGPGRADL